MGAWLSGLVAQWVPGSAGEWLSGRVAQWVHGSVGAWLGGYMAQWVHSSVGARLSGRADRAARVVSPPSACVGRAGGSRACTRQPRIRPAGRPRSLSSAGLARRRCRARNACSARCGSRSHLSSARARRRSPARRGAR